MEKYLKQYYLAALLIVMAFVLQAMPSYDDVLIVVNDKSPTSLEIGEYFRNARNISSANVCHVSVTDQQTVKLSEFGRATDVEKKAILDAIKKHLTDNKLTDKINYIVMTRGIPLYASAPEFAADAFHLTDVYLMFNLSESATDSSIPDIFVKNKYFYYYNTDILNKKFSRNKFGYYIVARLDGIGTSNIKAMIDSTGAPAYESYKKNGGKVKFLTLHQKSPSIVDNELKLRTNIEVARPPVNGSMALTATMDTVAKDVMFAYFNNVNFGYADFPADNNFYGDGDIVSQYPFIYRGATFLPGSFATCFRSHPTRLTNRDCGGLLKIDTKTKVMTDLQKTYDGTDMKFRHMTCVMYEPVNKQMWCGTGEPALNVSMSFDNRGTDEFFREHMRNEGGGIAILDAATGNIIKHINANDPGSSLKNNRVVKMVYDAASKRIWVAHYKGIQYYDLTAQAWNDVPALQNDFAAACDIYLDPFDSNKVYFTFHNTDNGNYKKVSSQIAGAATDVFEYSKSAGTVTRYTIDSDVMFSGISPLVVKTAANTLWVTKGRYYYNTSSKTVTRKIALIKYDLSSKTATEKIMLSDLIPEIATPPADLKTIALDSPRTLVVSNGKILTTVGCGMTYTAARKIGSTSYVGEKKNYLFRVTENAGTASSVEVIANTLMDGTHASIVPDFAARSLIADSKDSNILYMGLSWPYTSLFGLLQSTDGGTTWSKLSTSGRLTNVYDLALSDSGTLYAVRGYQSAQNLLYDFQAFGCTAFGGGMHHEDMKYNPSPKSGSAYGHPKGTEIYSASSSSIDSYSGVNYSQTEPMMFLYLDGFSMSETRFGVQSQYPRVGGGGYVGHMLVFEPKCAPFAPRVDEENMNPMIPDKKTIEIPLRSPGLPLSMDGFIPETINSSTVTIKDESGNPVTATVKYVASGTKIVLTGDFSGTYYRVTLKCGNDGIKNIKGACLTNTRANEFKDEITYTFGISSEVYIAPEDVKGPVKMPASSSKYDLIVNKVWWTTVPAVGQSLTVNFEISNIGTAKTSAGAGIQKAKVYLNNVLVDVKSYDDIAAKGKVSLTATIPGSLVAGNKQNKVMVWADSTDKVVEIRETNNTNTAIFMIETRPDLIVKEITLSPKPTANKPLTIYFKISNIGASATVAGAGVQVATVFVDGKAVGTVAYNDVPKGSFIAKQLVLPSGIAISGAHKIKVYADTNKAVDEISKLNNALEKSFTIAK
jgi:hypothetical protein